MSAHTFGESFAREVAEYRCGVGEDVTALSGGSREGWDA